MAPPISFPPSTLPNPVAHPFPFPLKPRIGDARIVHHSGRLSVHDIWPPPCSHRLPARPGHRSPRTGTHARRPHGPRAHANQPLVTAPAPLEVGFSQDLRSSAQNAPGRGQLCTAAPLPQQCRPRTAEPPRVRLVHCCRSCAPHALSWRLAVHCAHSCGSSARGGQLRQPAVHWQHRRGSSCALAALL